MARGKLGLAPKGQGKIVCVKSVYVWERGCQLKSPRGHQVHRSRQQRSLPVSSCFGRLLICGKGKNAARRNGATEHKAIELLYYLKQKLHSVSLLIYYFIFLIFRFCLLHFVFWTVEHTCTYITKHPAAAIWWHLAAG